MSDNGDVVCDHWKKSNIDLIFLFEADQQHVQVLV
jgi:hypothetical protein